jgi:hypothetical protein
MTREPANGAECPATADSALVAELRAEAAQLRQALDAEYLAHYGITYTELAARCNAVARGEVMTHAEAMASARGWLGIKTGW